MKSMIYKARLFKLLLALTLTIFGSGTVMAQALSGTYTIGLGGTYATVQAAADALTTLGVAGPVTFKIKTGAYSERAIIKAYPGASDSTRVKFVSETGNFKDVTISGVGLTNTDHHVIKLDGAKYVTIEGITIKGQGLYVSGIHMMNKCREIIVRNCQIITDSVGATTNAPVSAGIIAAVYEGTCVNSITGPGDHVDFFTADNNIIRGGNFAIYISGNTSSTRMNKTVIKNNKCLGFTTYGIYVYAGDYTEITGNTLKPNLEYTYLRGINLEYAKFSKVSGNKLDGAFQHGFYLDYVDNSEISNNMLAMLEKNITIEYGMYVYYSRYNNIHHNSIHLGMTSSTATVVSYGVYITGYATGNSLTNNNIFCTNGAIAYYLPGTTGYGTLDHNNLWTNGEALASISGALITDLPQLRDALNQEKNSISINPTTVSAIDLHTGDARLDGKGKFVGITNDIDGDTRNGRFPDIGCDEFLVLDKDLGVNQVQLVKVGADSLRAVVTLINDGKLSLNGLSAGLVYSVDNGSTWSTPETVSLTNLGTTYATQSYAFKSVFAQGKKSKFPLCVKIQTGVSGDANVKNDQLCDSICVGISAATFVVGSSAGADFSNLGAAVQYLNNLECGISGPITINVAKGNYFERVILNQIQGVSATNTITIQGQTGLAKDVTITSFGGGSITDHHTIQLNGADHTVFRNLTLENRGTAFGSCIQLKSQADSNLIENCILKLDSTVNSDSLIAIVTAFGNIGGDAQASGNIVRNNEIYGGGMGIRMSGYASVKGKNNRIEGNIIRGQKMFGIYMQRNDRITITGNYINLKSQKPNATGIFVVQSLGQANISDNFVYNVGNLGMYLDGIISENGSNSLVSNNMVGGTFHQEFSGYAVFMTGNNFMDVFHNSFSYTREGFATSAALYLEAGLNMNFYNNIYANSGGGYSVYLFDGSAAKVSDNNCFYTSGGVLAYWEGARSTLAALKSYSKKDDASIDAKPNFFAIDDLHTLEPALNGAARPLARVPFDIDGHARSTTTPDIGADEFTLGTDAAASEILEPGASFFGATDPGESKQVRIKISNLGSSAISAFDVAYSVDGVEMAKEGFSGSIAAPGNANHLFAAPWVIKDTLEHKLCAYTLLSGDAAPGNDTTCKTVKMKKVGVGLGETMDLGLSLYPIPANEWLNIKGLESKTQAYHIRDMRGRLVQDGVLYQESDILAVPLAELSPGAYVLILPQHGGAHKALMFHKE